VDGLAGRDLGLNRVAESDELLVPVALDADVTVEHIDGGKQSGRAVALTVGHTLAAAGLQRQPRLDAVQCLNPTMFTDAGHVRNAPAARHKARRCPAAWARTRGSATAISQPR